MSKFRKIFRKLQNYRRKSKSMIEDEGNKFCIHNFHHGRFRLTMQLIKQLFNLLIIKLFNKENQNLSLIRKTKLNWNKYIWRFFKDGSEFFQYFKANPDKIQFNNDMRIIFKVDKINDITGQAEVGVVEIKLQHFYFQSYTPNPKLPSQVYPELDYDDQRLERKMKIIFQQKRKKDMKVEKKMQKRFGLDEIQKYYEEQKGSIYRDTEEKRRIRRKKQQCPKGVYDSNSSNVGPDPIQLLKRIRQMVGDSQKNDDLNNDKDGVIDTQKQMKKFTQRDIIQKKQTGQQKDKQASQNPSTPESKSLDQKKKLKLRICILKAKKAQNKQLIEVLQSQKDFNRIQLMKNGFNLKNMGFVELFDQLKCISLKSNKIAAIQGLENCVNLQILDLSNNSIVKIEALGNNRKLQKLILTKNKIETLDGIFHLESLECLHLSYNSIKEIPTQITLLLKLNDFRLKQNKLQTVPSILLSLNYLKLVSLNQNPVFPHPTQKISNYKNLKFEDQRQFLEQCEKKGIKVIDKE